jgi:hypothetical protein
MSPVVLFSRYPYVLSLFCISPFSCSSFVHNVYFCSIYRYLVVLIHHNVSTCPYLSPIQALISFAFFMYVSTIVFYRTAFNLFSHMSFLPPSFMATPASSFYLLLLISRYPEPILLNVYGALELIPSNEFRQPMSPGGPVRKPYSSSVPSPHRLFKNSSSDIL